MGLPDDYLLPLRYNDAYHLLGDGVVVPVVAHLRSEILTPIVVANELGKATASSHVRRKKA
jgi:DNA (cytosine-5)-methyltransferase 1